MTPKQVAQLHGYKDGRLYVQNALLDEAKNKSIEIQKFVVEFLKLHGDTNVEVR